MTAGAPAAPAGPESGYGDHVQKEWADSFESFHSDMGDPPSDRHVIGRRVPSGPFCRGNCVWAVPEKIEKSTQLVLDGESATVSQWGKRTGLGSELILGRLEAGWSISRTLLVAAK
jgi:hypothetical protein